MSKGTNFPDIPLPRYLSIPNLPLNAGTVFAFLYAILYVLLEPVAGALIAPIIIGSTAYGNYLIHLYGPVVNYWATTIHVLCWIAQFIGHGKYEGRAPALLDNLVQALFLAPFFVWFEILFRLGYRPELKSRLDKSIEVEVSKFQDSKAKSAKNGTT